MIRVGGSYSLSEDNAIVLRLNGGGQVSPVKTFESKRPFIENAGKKGMVETAASSNVGFSGIVLGANFQTKFLEGFIDPSIKSVYDVYRDIYTYDPIAGGTVDLMSSLPYSDFDLVGLKDREMVRVFEKTMEKMQFRTLLPGITKDHLVMGAFVGTLVLDSKQDIFIATVPYEAKWCTFIQAPIHGVDPMISIDIPDEVKKGFQKVFANEAMLKLMGNLPDELTENLKRGKFGLDPAVTIYVPNRGLSTDAVGLSVYNRIILIHLMEKAVARGSTELAHRRLKALLHVAAGDDLWEPTPQDLADISTAFNSADADPLSAVVVTRNGINVNEIRQPTDFWSWDSITEGTAMQKMRALGINDAFLSGDSNYNTMQGALTVFVKRIVNIRDNVTGEVFDSRILPYTAYLHGFERDEDYEESSDVKKVARARERLGQRWRKEEDASFTLTVNSSYTNRFSGIDPSKYIRPKIHYHEKLEPQEDTEWLQVLDTLTQHGVPVPLRMWAAGGGMNIEDLIEQFEDDKKIREKVFAFQEEIKEYMPQPDEQVQSALANLMGGNKARSILSREYDEDAKYAVHGVNKAGRRVPLSKAGKVFLNEKINRQIASAAAEIHRKRNMEKNDAYRQFKDRQKAK